MRQFDILNVKIDQRLMMNFGIIALVNLFLISGFFLFISGTFEKKQANNTLQRIDDLNAAYVFSTIPYQVVDLPLQPVEFKMNTYNKGNFLPFEKNTKIDSNSIQEKNQEKPLKKALKNTFDGIKKIF